MNEHKIKRSVQTIETTVGELVEIITQIALETGKTEEEGYRLASLTVEKILHDNGKHILTA